MAGKAKQDLAIFEQFEIRRYFDEDSEKWVFSVIDIVVALKNRLKNEECEVVTNCHQLKMFAQDGKM